MIPTAKCIALLLRCFFQLNLWSIRVRFYWIIKLIINKVCYSIFIHLKASFNHYIFSWHIKSSFRTPTAKCIALFLRFLPQLYRCIVLIGLDVTIKFTIDLICYRITINTVMAFNFHIFSRHIKSAFTIPAAKCIALFLRFCSQGHWRSKFIAFCIPNYLSVNFVYNRIVIDIKTAFNYYVSSWHRKSIRLIPTTKCVAILFRIFSQGYRSSIFVHLFFSVILTIY